MMIVVQRQTIESNMSERHKRNSADADAAKDYDDSGDHDKGSHPLPNRMFFTHCVNGP